MSLSQASHYLNHFLLNWKELILPQVNVPASMLSTAWDKRAPNTFDRNIEVG